MHTHVTWTCHMYMYMYSFHVATEQAWRPLNRSAVRAQV